MRALFAVPAVLAAGCEQKADPTSCAVKLEFIPSSDRPAVPEYHSTKACVRLHHDSKTPRESSSCLLCVTE